MTDDPRSIRRLAAIMAADVVGYSRMMAIDEVGTLAALKRHRQAVFDPAVAAHGGRVVKLMGDGTLVEFASVVDAVSCALAIQKGTATEGAGIVLRIGINLGDVIVDGDDIYGDGVNVAARLESLAEPGGICVAGIVVESVGNRVGAAFSDAGEVTVKNIDRPIRIWRSQPVSSSANLPGPPPATPRGLTADETPSIAVLPFRNLSGEAEQEYFADGITEDIITGIAKIPGLLVIARNSTFTYKGKAAKAQEVCADLGVRYVMDGSVRKAGDRVRITAQLVDGASGGQLWAERYDRELADIFSVQDDVTRNIIEALEVKFSRRAARAETESPAAYDLILRAREQYRLFSAAGNKSARTLFEKAIAIDPGYAAAYAGLALCHQHDWFMGSAESLETASQLAIKAHELDPLLPQVFEALGNIQLFRRQHGEALTAALRWVEIEPGNADAYANLAGALHFSGEAGEALPLIERAMRLNPLYPFYYMLYRGQCFLVLERYQEALEAIERSAVRNPDALPAQVYLAACLGLLGRETRAQAALDEARRILPGFSRAWVETFLPYKRDGDMERVREGLGRAGLSL